MTKTVIIPDDVHLLIVKKQISIREKYGVTLRISDMVAVGMRNIVDKIEELFNLSNRDAKMVIDEGVKIDESDDKRIVLVEQGDVRT